MALAATIVWEVRTDGSDNSGGGFKTGASGTDYSQQAAAQKSNTDLEIHASDNTKLKPVAAGVAAADIGNVVQITAGSGFTTGFYEITAQDGTYWTVDRATGTIGSTGGTYAMGGALASPGKAGSAKVAGNDVYIKAGTYSITSASANVASGCVTDSTGGTSTNDSRWIGYDTTRTIFNTDTKPLLQASGAISSFTIFNASADRITAYNLSIDCASKTTSTGMTMTDYTRAIRCKVANATTRGIDAGGNSGFIIGCEVTGCSGMAIYINTNGTAYACEAYANTNHGFRMGGGQRAYYCVSYGNTGASTDGFFGDSSSGMFLVGCVAYANGRSGFDLTGNASLGSLLANCIAEGNSGEGYRATAVSQGIVLQNCAGYNNTSGNYNSSNIDLVYNFKALTGSPFTAAGSNDFSLNNTAGAGADCRATGHPGTLPRATTVGYVDIGAAQHQDPAGGGGLLTNPGMGGGMRG